MRGLPKGHKWSLSMQAPNPDKAIEFGQLSAHVIAQVRRPQRLRKYSTPARDEMITILAFLRLRLPRGDERRRRVGGGGRGRRTTRIHCTYCRCELAGKGATAARREQRKEKHNKRRGAETSRGEQKEESRRRRTGEDNNNNPLHRLPMRAAG